MSFFPGVVTKNWQLKVSALAMAVLLWTVPRFESQSSQVLEDLPVRVRLSDPNWAQLGEASPATVSVTVSGPARDLFALGVERPPVTVPVDEVSSMDTTVLLLSSWFRVSGRDVVVEDMTPDFVNIRFEGIERRELGLSAPFAGDLPQGVSMAGPPVIDPPVVTAQGAASRFEGVDSLRLLPLDLARLSEPGPFLVAVDTAGLQGVDIFPLEVSVQVPVDSTATREFADLVLELPTLDSDPQIQAQRTAVTVVLIGARSLVEAVDPESIVVTIPTGLANLAPGQEKQVVVVVEGIPDLVEARTNPDWVLLRRPVGQ